MVYDLQGLGLTTDEIVQHMDVKASSVERYLRIATQKVLPKILIYDVETSPMEVLVWGLYKQRIPIDNIVKEWAILSWAAKWLNNPNVMSAVVTPKQATDRKDKDVVEKLWSLFEEADVVVAHNALKFDNRKMNARWKVNGLMPCSPFQTIDTLKVAQKSFAFSSHKLNYLTDLLVGNQKIKTEYGLWKRCINGEQESLDEMLRYNKQDVLILEDLYFELRPWIKSHPNIGLYLDGTGEVCANCGSSLLDWDIKPYYTSVGRFKAYRCKSCCAIGRSRYSDLSQEERKNLLVGTAR